MKTEASIQFGENLKAVRLDKGHTQAQVAEAVDITPRFLADLESGAKAPSLLTVLRLAKALKVETTTLLVGMKDLIEVPNEQALKKEKIDRRKSRGARPLR